MIKGYSKYSDTQLYNYLNNEEHCESAFAELYARYSQKIYAYCIRVNGNEEDAMDVFQETFLKFFDSAKQHINLDNVFSFLLKIARNLCLNIKRDKRKVYSLDDIQLYSNERDDDQKELLQLIATSLEFLEIEYRELFVLRQYHGLSYQEISDVTNIPVSTVKTKVWRAKEKIKEILSPYLEELSK